MCVISPPEDSDGDPGLRDRDNLVNERSSSGQGIAAHSGHSQTCNDKVMTENNLDAIPDTDHQPGLRLSESGLACQP